MEQSFDDEEHDDPTIELEKSKHNFTIKKITKKSDSEIWKHFGELYHKSGTIISDKKYTDKIFCIYCYKNANDNKPKFKGYSKATSTTVLYGHLLHHHNIKRESVSVDQKQRKLEEALFYDSANVSRSKKMKRSEEDEFILNRRFCIWLCRDLLPLDVVEKKGFKDFWTNVKEGFRKPPSRSTVSREALDDVYTCLKSKLINHFTKIPKNGTIAFDGWMDRFHHHSYITYNYHYMDNDWTMKNVVLKTSRFDHPHTGESLKQNYLEVIEEFGIDDKMLIAVTDGGSNMIKCLKLLKVQRIGCVAHSCNRLIVHDLMQNCLMKDIIPILNKLKIVQRKLSFKYPVLKMKNENDHQIKLLSMLNDLTIAYEAMKDEAQYVDAEEFERMETEFAEELNKPQSDFHGIYSSSKPIRWNLLYYTIRSHLKHHSIIRATLEEMGEYEAILTGSEMKLLQGLADVLRPFKEFTKVIQGVTYPTINLIPLFLTEIESKLEELRLFTTDTFVLEAIDILLINVRKRIELTEVVVAAGCLDPGIQHLPILESWLQENGLTRGQLIRKVIKDYNITLPEQQSTTTAEASSSNTTEEAVRQNTDQQAKVSYYYYVTNLISKYASNNNTANRSSTIDSEFVQFRLEIQNDALQFWKCNAKKYPNLSAVAHTLLAIPIANGKSEGNFSISGCLLRKERAKLEPLRAEKILFIHDNYDLFGFNYL